MKIFFHSYNGANRFYKNILAAYFVIAALTIGVGRVQAQSAGGETYQEPKPKPAPASSTPVSTHEADYMNQALQRVFRKAEAVTKVKDKLLAGYGFDQEGECLWGAFLKVGQQITLDTTLEAGRSYFFVGAGDDFVTNLDIIITDTSGHILGQDTEAGKEAGVLFKPKYNGGYKVLLRLKAGDRFGLCALACLKRPGGWLLNHAEFTQTANVFKTGVQSWWKSFKGGSFLHNGQWCLVMGVVQQGRTLTWSHTIPPGRLALTTVQDGRARDLDLYLVNANDEVVTSDTTGGSTPGFTYNSPGGGAYTWEIKAVSTTGPSLVGVALLELPR
ncbi:hypothetical protein IAD21_05900 [Abditibacteriota bacterium]|nr:hypothetical protein IAD21_05900 [Abditibacteriota bacterium]